MFENIASLYLFWPENVLLIGIGFLLVLDLALRGSSRKIAGIVTLITLGGLGAATALTSGRTGGLFGGLVARDPYGDFFKYLFAATSAFTVVFTLSSGEALERSRPKPDAGEFFLLLLGVTLGMNLMAVATDLLMAYMALEMVSLLSYVLAGFRRQDLRSSEAALKYAIYGGVASGLMLYGMSLLYGLAGTTSLQGVRQALITYFHSPVALVGISLLMVGLGFKIAAVPFHFWCPDVYEGAPTAVTAFFSVGPKAAGFALLIRFLTGIAPDLGPAGYPQGSTIGVLLGTMAIVTMTVGNLVAIPQDNLKRLLAYSSIAHAGYLLMGVAVGTQAGTQAVMLYLVIYLLMNLGAFLVVLAIAESGLGETVQDYRALGYRSPFAAAVMGVFLISLTGIPPTAGFIGKFYLFAAVLEKGGPFYVVLAIVGITNSVISLYYYARILKAMYLEREVPEGGAVRIHTTHAVSLGALATLTLVLGVYWAPVVSFVSRSLSVLGAVAAVLPGGN